MQTPKLDGRDRRDIMDQLKALARSYVPEWRWDEEHPDAGMVLAHVYAAMMENTVSKYNRTMYNHFLSFLNLLGTRLLPPAPAEGMVTVEVLPDGGEVYLPQGTVVYAAADTDAGRVFYETTQGMTALDTQVDSIFFTSAEKDTIVMAYDRNEPGEPVRLFDLEGYPQLQQHILVFRDDRAFYTKDRTHFIMRLDHALSEKQRRQLAEVFSNEDMAQWEYHTETGWKPFDRVLLTEEGIGLEGSQGSHPVEVEGEQAMGLLRCRLKQIPDGGVSFTHSAWKGWGEGLAPDALSWEGNQLPEENFSPFGDGLSIFTAFQFSSREAFSKAGAVITVDFTLEYYKVPIEQAYEPDPIRYRSVMTREDFEGSRERDVRIERVVWEYWNGLGWARLFPLGEEEDFFTPDQTGVRVKRLTFRCPPDMESLLVGAAEGLFIRARIDKLSYLFSTKGHYIVPFVRHMEIGYRYQDWQEGKEVLVESNVERNLVELPHSGQTPLVTAGLCPDPAMYVCFTNPLTGGPLRIFWDVAEGVFPAPPPLRWEYYGITVNGEPGWKSIEVMDQTENLTRSGMVTLVGKKDFAKARFFGREGYFVRLVDVDGRYDEKKKGKNPVLRAVWPNTVPVIQRERGNRAYFYIGRGEKNKRCSLNVPNLWETKVWVNEHGSLSVKEEEQLLQNPDVLVQRSAEGTVEQIWVPWREVDRLEGCGGEERVYMVDYSQGDVVFGDGRHGRIPPESPEESILVEHTRCDGHHGNIPQGAILGFLSRPAGVAGVTNHKPISGGSPMETIGQAAHRRTGEVLEMDRLVTLEDLERAVLASNRNIFRVKCAAHVDRYGRPAEGKLAVAVLPRTFGRGGEFFDALVRRARQMLEEKASLLLAGGGQVDFFEVRYVEVYVTVDAVIPDYDCYHETHQAIRHRLEEFLNPITGNFGGQGWEIGQIPSRELIYNSIKTIPNIKWIRGLHLFTYMVTQDGRQAVEFDRLRRDGFTVPVCGEPEINLTAEQGR